MEACARMHRSFLARSAVERVLLACCVIAPLWLIVGWAIAIP
jgi:hypothetical protein